MFVTKQSTDSLNFLVTNYLKLWLDNVLSIMRAHLGESPVLDSMSFKKVSHLG